MDVRKEGTDRECLPNMHIDRDAHSEDKYKDDYVVCDGTILMAFKCSRSIHSTKWNIHIESLARMSIESEVSTTATPSDAV